MKESKITAIIVDDEEEARDILDNLLKDFEEIEIISKESNVDSAIATIIAHKPDIIFLDIEMPGKDGFYLINEIHNLKLNPAIIFITAYNRAVEAFEQAAFDYLMKPIEPDRLRKSIDRYKTEKIQNLFDERFEKLMNLIKCNKIRINTRAGFVLLDTEKIVYCQANGNYTEIFLNTSITETVTQQLGQFEKLLPQDIFFRINRSAIINLNYLSKINRKSKTCELIAGKEKYTLEATRELLRKLEKKDI